MSCFAVEVLRDKTWSVQEKGEQILPWPWLCYMASEDINFGQTQSIFGFFLLPTAPAEIRAVVPSLGAAIGTCFAAAGIAVLELLSSEHLKGHGFPTPMNVMSGRLEDVAICTIRAYHCELVAPSEG